MLKKTIIAAGVAMAMSAGAQAATLTAGNYNMFVKTDGVSCFDFGNCVGNTAKAFVDNNADATAGGGSAIAGDGYAGIINISATDNGAGGVNFSVNSFNMDTYLGTAGGAFGTWANSTAGMSGSVDASGKITMDLSGRMGIAQYFQASLGAQPWNVDDSTAVASSGAFQLFTTGTSSNLDPSGGPTPATLQGSILDASMNAVLVSAGNVGKAWGGFDGTPYTEVFSVKFAPVSAVPVPAAVWLFGSGLLGLAGVARRKKVA